MKFNIIIVFYNAYLSTNKFINEYNNDSISIYVYDNSTNRDILLSNKEYAKLKQINYFSNGNNIGLSKAYNYIIQGINKTPDDWILILDQDTHISFDDVKIYEKNILNNKEKKIFVPIILDSIGIMSPSTIKKNRYIHTKKMNLEYIECYSFINSCMCVNAEIFNDIKYDENLFLDCIDHDFIKSIKKNYGNNLFFIMNELKIFQEFSGVTINSINSDLVRFRIFLKDYTFFNKKWRINNKSLLLKRALKLSILHRNIVFLKEYCQRKYL